MGAVLDNELSGIGTIGGPLAQSNNVGRARSEWSSALQLQCGLSLIPTFRPCAVWTGLQQDVGLQAFELLSGPGPQARAFKGGVPQRLLP